MFYYKSVYLGLGIPTGTGYGPVYILGERERRCGGGGGGGAVALAGPKGRQNAWVMPFQELLFTFFLILFFFFFLFLSSFLVASSFLCHLH